MINNTPFGQVNDSNDAVPSSAHPTCFIETIVVYKLPQLSREEIRDMIGLKDIELKQTRFYQDVFKEGHQEGCTGQAKPDTFN